MDLSKLRFRHVFGESQQQKYENIMSSTMTLESCGIKGNPYYCAFTWKTAGGGALCILDNNKQQKLSIVPPMIVGHQGAVLDFDFHPFNDYYIATASDDTEIRLWEIPEEFTQDVNEPIIKISGHQKRVQLIQFNHTSNNILCSSSADGTVRVWNLEKSKESNFSVQIPEIATSLAWNYQGNLLGMTNKDKFMRILDPRVGQFAGNVKCHEGPKSQKFSWMGNSDYCVTTGFSKKFDRQFNLWDLRSLDKPIQTQNIDNSSGVIFPFYDTDTGLLFLAGKGDGNIRFYEFYDGQFFKCSNSYTTNKSGMAYGFYSKRSVNVLKHELMRGLKLTDSVYTIFFNINTFKKTVEFISFFAPRKAENFQEDLFPNTIGNIPAQSGEDWFMGQTKPPVLISMAPDFGRKTIQSKQVQMTLQNLKLQSKESSQQQSTQEQQQQVLPDIGYLKSLQEKYEIAKNENNNLRNQQRDWTIQIDSLENELRLVSQAQQEQQNEQEIEQLQQQQCIIQELEDKVLYMTNELDSNQQEIKQITQKINDMENQNEAIINQLDELQNQIQEAEINQIEEQKQLELETELENEDLKQQKELFLKAKQQNYQLNEQLKAIQKEQLQRKQNEDFQQVINILLNQEDKFVNELKSIMFDRKSALNVIKQSM